MTAFIKDLGVEEISGYPFDAPCSDGKGVGERCVSKQRYVCAKDLVCLRWKAGMGRYVSCVFPPGFAAAWPVCLAKASRCLSQGVTVVRRPCRCYDVYGAEEQIEDLGGKDKILQASIGCKD